MKISIQSPSSLRNRSKHCCKAAFQGVESVDSVGRKQKSEVRDGKGLGWVKEGIKLHNTSLCPQVCIWRDAMLTKCLFAKNSDQTQKHTITYTNRASFKQSCGWIALRTLTVSPHGLAVPTARPRSYRLTFLSFFLGAQLHKPHVWGKAYPSKPFAMSITY